MEPQHLRAELLAAAARLSACELPVEEAYYVRECEVACVSQNRGDTRAARVVPVMHRMQWSSSQRLTPLSPRSFIP